MFNQDGDRERGALRPGNVHSAHGWRETLEPVGARYRGQVRRRLCRGDAAFAWPDRDEFWEAEGFPYALHLPVAHGRYLVFQMAAVAVPPERFRRILDRIDRRRTPILVRC